MESIEINNTDAREELLLLQRGFLNSTLGKIVDNSINITLEKILPDFLDEEIIEIKDAFFREGYKEGIQEIIEKVTQTAENLKAISTGNFEDISQIKEVIEKNGLLDGISDVIDKILEKLEEKDILSKTTTKIIKNSKKEIISDISDNLEELYEDQSENFEKIYNYCEKWKEAYQNQKFSTMETNYKKIESLLEETMPIENILKEAREIENLHTLIKNNDKQFNLTEEEKELAEKLITTD